MENQLDILVAARQKLESLRHSNELMLESYNRQYTRAKNAGDTFIAEQMKSRTVKTKSEIRQIDRHIGQLVAEIEHLVNSLCGFVTSGNIQTY